MVYKVISNHGEHEYNLTLLKVGDTTEYTLSYSEGDLWGNVNGQNVIKVTDNGGGLSIQKYLKTSKGELRYDEATYLYIILSYINSVDTLFRGKIGTFETVVDV